MSELKWKPGDPEFTLAHKVFLSDRDAGLPCQFCGKSGAEELWKGALAHSACLDAGRWGGAA